MEEGQRRQYLQLWLDCSGPAAVDASPVEPLQLLK